jgi:hypothetical protein
MKTLIFWTNICIYHRIEPTLLGIVKSKAVEYVCFTSLTNSYCSFSRSSPQLVYVPSDGARDHSSLYEGAERNAERAWREQTLDHRETPELAPMSLECNRKALLQALGQARALNEKNCLRHKAVV